MTPFRLIYLYINIKLDKNQICVVKIIQGGGVAAPIASQVLGEVLPYLEVVKENQKEEDIRKEVEVPNIEGMTLEEAIKELKNIELEISYEIKEGEEIDKKQVRIKEQLPTDGIKIYSGTKVYVTLE